MQAALQLASPSVQAVLVAVPAAATADVATSILLWKRAPTMPEATALLTWLLCAWTQAVCTPSHCAWHALMAA